MNLGKRILFMFVATGGCLLILLGLAARFFVLDGYREIERQSILNDLSRGRSALSDRVDSLAATDRDWASWDDAYAFMQGRNPAFAKTYLTTDSLASLKINAILLCNNSGDVTGEFYRDLPIAEADFAAELRRAIAGGKSILSPAPGQGVSGVLILPRLALLISSQAVLTSQRTGPSQGALIMARILTPAVLKEMAGATGTRLDVLPPDGGNLNADEEDLRARLAVSGGEDVLTRAREISAYGQIRDAMGNPALILKVTQDRGIWRTGVVSVIYFAAFLGLCCAVLILATMWFVKRSVLAPLDEIGGLMSQIGRDGDMSRRLPENGAEEWRAMARNINRMLAGLEGTGQAMLDKEEFFRGIVESLPVGLFRRTPGEDGRIVQVNQTFLRMFGFASQEDAARVSFAGLYHNPEDAGVFSRMIRSGGNFAYFESRFRRRDGRILWGAITGRLSANAETGQEYYDCVIQDVTQRRLAEDSMRESERRYRLLVDHSYEAIAVMQGERMVFISPRMTDIFEWSMHELLDKSPMDLIHPEDHHIVLERLGAQIRGVPTTPVYSVRMLTASNEVKWVQMSTNLIEWDGHPAVLIFLTDVTEGKRTEDALRLSREKYKILFDVFPVGVVITDFQGDVVEANEAGMRLLGVNEMEAFGANLRDGRWKIVNPDGSPCPLAQFPLASAARGGQEVRNLEFGVVKDDGQVVWLLASITPIPFEGLGAAVVFTDITEHKSADAHVEESEKRYRGLIESFPTTVALLQNNRVVYVNEAAVRTFGADGTEELCGTDIMSWVSEDEVGRIRGYLAKREAEGDDGLPLQYQSIFRRKSGEEFPVEVFVRTVDYQAAPARQVIIFDITERKRAEEMILTQKMVFEQLFQNSPESIVICDKSGTITAANKAFRELFGYTDDEAIGYNIDSLVVPPESMSEGLALTEAAVCGSVMRTENTRRRKDGSQFDASILCFPLSPGNGEDGFYVVYSDISERRRNEKYIQYLAHHDNLTGLPNRLLLEDRLNQAMARADRFQGMVGILFLDLDAFKNVNDTFGHKTGDDVLVETAKRITSCLREMDTVARTGGDEFVIVIEDAKGVDSMRKVAEKIIAAICQDHILGEETTCIGASVGLSVYPSDGKDMDTLLSAADSAMYAAKNKGRNLCLHCGEV